MKKGQPINIRMVHNGYIVTPEAEPHMCISDSDTMVFNDFKKMTKWIEFHFAEDKIPERDLKPACPPPSGK